MTLSACATPTVDQIDDGTLQVQLAAGLEIPQQVLDGFAAQTGITVTVDNARSDAELAAAIAGGAPDLVLGVSDANASRLDRSDGLVSYVSPAAGDGAADFALSTSDRLTAVSYDYVCAVADDDALAAEGADLPADLATAIASDQQVVAPDPSTSSAGMAVLTAAAEASDTAVAALHSATLAATEAEALRSSSLAGGAAPIVFASATAAINTFPDRNISVVDGSCVRRVRYAGIAAESPHVNQARKFIDWLLGASVQADLAATWQSVAVQRDVAVPEAYRVFVDPFDQRLSAGLTLGDLQPQQAALLAQWQSGS